MKQFHFIILFTLISLLGFGQSKEIFTGEQKLGELEYYDTPIFGSWIRSSSNGVYYGIIDDEYIATGEGSFTELIKNYENEKIPLPKEWNELEFKTYYCFAISDTVHHVQSFRDKSKLILFHTSFNLKTHEQLSQRRVICEYEYDSKKDAKNGSWQMEISKDESKILFRPYIPYRKGNQPICFFLFNSNFDLIHEERSELPYDNEDFNLIGCKTSNTGKVWIFGIYSGKEYKKTPFKYKYHFFSVDKGKALMDEIVVEPLAGLNNATITLSNKDDLVLVGLFHKKTKSYIQGTWLLKIDAQTNEIRTNKLSDLIRNDDLNGFGTGSYKSRDIARIYFDEEDNITVVADEVYEQKKYQVDKYVMDSKGVQKHVQKHPYFIYSSYDIQVFKLDDQGDILWNRRVKKYQKIQDRISNSYVGSSVFYRNGMLHMLFYDNPENENYNPYEDEFLQVNNKTVKEKFITLVSMDENGKQFRQTLIDEEKREVNPKILILKTKMISENELLIPVPTYSDLKYRGDVHYLLRFD
jgi:hypothetical protein